MPCKRILNTGRNDRTVGFRRRTRKGRPKNDGMEAGLGKTWDDDESGRKSLNDREDWKGVAVAEKTLSESRDAKEGEV